MEGQGCVAGNQGDVSCLVRRVRHVMPSQVVPEDVGEGPEEPGVAGGGGGAAGVAGCTWW